jgi:hypothetical protein
VVVNASHIHRAVCLVDDPHIRPCKATIGSTVHQRAWLARLVTGDIVDYIGHVGLAFGRLGHDMSDVTRGKFTIGRLGKIDKKGLRFSGCLILILVSICSSVLNVLTQIKLMHLGLEKVVGTQFMKICHAYVGTRGRL